MFTPSLCCALLCIVAVATPAKCEDAAIRLQPIQQYKIELPGTGYDIGLGAPELRQPTSALGRAFLTAIETWLSIEFDLPEIHRHPRVEFVPAERIVQLRYKAFLSPHIAADDLAAAAARSDTLAVYSDATETISLPENWGGNSPVELSVLVHEMVHHFQNLLGLKYQCPQEREMLAYTAQNRLLGLFGQSLENEFGLDPFSLLVKTKCFF